MSNFGRLMDQIFQKKKKFIILHCFPFYYAWQLLWNFFHKLCYRKCNSLCNNTLLYIMGTENFRFICSSITQFKIVFAIAFLLFSGFFHGSNYQIIVAGTIGAYLFFFMAFGKYKQNKIKLIFIFIFLGVGFWVPFFLLELVNHHLSGITADHFYSGK